MAIGAVSFTFLFSILAFVFGLFLGYYLPFIPLTVVFILVVLAGVLTWCERKAPLSRRRGLILYAGLVLGVGYWFLGDWNTDAAELTAYAGSHVMLSGTVVTPVAHSPNRRTMEVAVEWVQKENIRRSVQGRLRLTWRESDTDVFRGDTITVLRTRLRRPFGTRNPGGFDYGAHLRDRGIHVVATVKGPKRVQVQPPEVVDVVPWVWHGIDQWRNQVRQTVIATLQQPARGLFLGTIVGEQRDIPVDVRDDFMTTGTVHIISISGSHLGLLAFLSFFGVKGGGAALTGVLAGENFVRPAPKATRRLGHDTARYLLYAVVGVPRCHGQVVDNDPVISYGGVDRSCAIPCDSLGAGGVVHHLGRPDGDL